MNPLELVPLEGALSEEEKLRFLEKLWGLLARQTALYTMDESTSVSTERAQELLASICCTLRFELDFSHLPISILAEGDLHSLLHDGQAHLEKTLRELKALWMQALTAANNQHRRDTIESLLRLKPIFSGYDLYFAAHKIPPDAGFLLHLDSLCADLFRITEYVGRGMAQASLSWPSANSPSP